MRTKAAWRIIGAVIAGGAALATAILPASGATSAAQPAWRVVKTFGPAVGVWTDQLTAVSGRDSWSTWVACRTGPCGTSKGGLFVYVEHSGGTSWKAIRVPAALTAGVAQSVALGASSASNVWLVDPPARSASTTRVFRWNGSRWLVLRIPAWAVVLNRAGEYNVTAAVFSPTSVWLLDGSFAARFNGHRWSKVAIPHQPYEFSVRSQSDIWGMGYATAGANPAQVVVHWNGKRWRTIAIPRVRVPAHSVEFTSDLLAVGPANVWLQRNIERGTAGATTMYMLHWNGRTWKRIAIPANVTLVDDMTQDGHGGLWLAANGPAPAYRWYLYHYTGKWARFTVPAAKGTTVLDLTGLSWIPGTRSVWATANMVGPGANGGIFGAILKHDG